jgi:twitching motility protein PilT
MVGTPAVSNMIREGKTFQIPSMIQTGKKDGMVLMDQSIRNLLMAGTVDDDEAFAKAVDKSAFKKDEAPKPEMAANRR